MCNNGVENQDQMSALLSQVKDVARGWMKWRGVYIFEEKEYISESERSV